MAIGAMLSAALQAGGVVLVGLAIVQALVFLYQSVLQTIERRRQFRLDSQLLSSQLETARLRHRYATDSADAWKGYRKFVVDRVRPETDGTSSVYLSPHDRRRLPLFYPGQHLTFRFQVPGHKDPINRCYSLSDHPGASRYRITVKKLLPAPGSGGDAGKSSTYVNEQLSAGDIVDVRAPKGDFFLDLSTSHPIVCLAAGIGVTPMISMLRALQEQGSGREVWLFYGVKDRQQYLFGDFLEAFAQANENFHLKVVFSGQPSGEFTPAHVLDGHVNMQLIRSQLVGNNYEFFVCGPPAMMRSVVSGLLEWGVPKKMIRCEAYGPASIHGLLLDDSPKGNDTESLAFDITFAKSDKTVSWTPASGTLLDLATANGVSIASGCCAGECLTCDVALVSGHVRYLKQPSEKPREGSCLPCISVPTSHLRLDA